MRDKRLWRYSKFILLAGAIAFCSAPLSVSAVTSTSAHYQVNETQFSAGSTAQNCSVQYCAQASIGETATGTSSNTVHTATFGPVTQGEPLLEVIVDTGVSNLGVLSTEHTSTKTTTVQVRTYLSDGYTLQIVGNAPKYNSHSLATPSTPTASLPGTEQFGINAVANTSPSVGANLVQTPVGQTGVGIINDPYNIPNKFQYINGDVVAHSTSPSGTTSYTVSMIVNISNATPAGHYSGDFSAIVTPVY